MVTTQQGEPRILFVDDEKELLEASAIQLQRFGWQVTGAFSGTDALAALSQNPDAFCVLVTDLFMPGMDGRELIEWARAIRADLPVILLSGMGDAIDQDILDAMAPVQVMWKPLRIAELVDVVKQLVGHRPRG